jgi:hypothetical protein
MRTTAPKKKKKGKGNGKTKSKAINNALGRAGSLMIQWFHPLLLLLNSFLS